jgi:ribose transport system ATP-binding protein
LANGLANRTEAPPLLAMRGISKSFPGLIALDAVDFTAQAGEIHALIGQNGAGKSTLMKILAGVYQAESGQILIDGARVHFSSPRDALRAGIGIVYQDLSLVPALSVADNILLGREPGGGIQIDQRAILAQAAATLARLGVSEIDPRARVSALPLAQQQLVEIAKVLSYEPRILVMDEPTAALAEEETALLLRSLRGLRERGIGIIYISHRFKEILALCDRATVLRNGRVVAAQPLAGASEDDLIELTLGGAVEAVFQRDTQPHQSGKVALEVRDLKVGRAVRGVSFALHRGEIVGMTGLLGAGQNEVARALFGIVPEMSGIILRDGKPVMIHSPAAAIRHGIGLLTEQRKTEGLIPARSIRENISLPSLARFGRALGVVEAGREGRAAAEMMTALNVKATSAATKVNTLSGGNQQKVILGRWLLRDPEVLMFISPTQGIDVGAKAEIYAALHRLAAGGKTILVVSEDHLEVLYVADRILVMHGGRLAREFARGEANEERLLSAIQGNPV